MVPSTRARVEQDTPNPLQVDPLATCQGGGSHGQGLSKLGDDLSNFTDSRGVLCLEVQELRRFV